MRVGVDGEFVVSRFPLSASIVTVSVLVSDATRVNAATVAVTVAFVGGPYEWLWFSPRGNDYVVSPDYTGVVVTLTATGGFGGYRYECERGCDLFGVDADTGVVSLTTALLRGQSGGGAVFIVRDRGGLRDLLYRFCGLTRESLRTKRCLLWGGNSGTAASDYEGVLRSTDGETWTSVSFPNGAPWASDGFS